VMEFVMFRAIDKSFHMARMTYSEPVTDK
jgi:hypothetical protein